MPRGSMCCAHPWSHPCRQPHENTCTRHRGIRSDPRRSNEASGRFFRRKAGDDLLNPDFHLGSYVRSLGICGGTISFQPSCCESDRQQTLVGRPFVCVACRSGAPKRAAGPQVANERRDRWHESDSPKAILPPGRPPGREPLCLKCRVGQLVADPSLQGFPIVMYQPASKRVNLS